MQDVFNWRLYQQGGNDPNNEWYTSTVVPASPSSAQGSTYKIDLVFDISYYYPEALNQYSTGRDNHLPYQPASAWQHWIVGRVYSSSGAVTIVNDPGWSVGNDRYVTSVGGVGTIIYMFGGHGYTW